MVGVGRGGGGGGGGGGGDKGRWRQGCCSKDAVCRVKQEEGCHEFGHAK